MKLDLRDTERLGYMLEQFYVALFSNMMEV